ncbi:KGGVGR-motif variant AAA ATPase [Pseudanabaena sp. ABRG5-3]|uniref:KGGVGR-motif variant AAA ATPase n=1 Tax=Pseudanabaena sp. ABRG5-3 TaxID=685565 RepID=UPI000DC6E34A|nr:hypothetical protein [Pseudanabaena sp. ABRG5-3]BBC26653.1 hypothetical protein ABRG53_a079 [Pseudanabaena sp. ABRG5-3]
MIYTFYSFKGGTGRSMALANLGELFYRLGLKVLMIDFDLEAPGLERYFDVPEAIHKPTEILEKRGVIDLLVSYKQICSLPPLKVSVDRDNTSDSNSSFNEDSFPLSNGSLNQFITSIYERKSGNEGKLSLISAGRREKDGFSNYASRVHTFDWNDFYLNWNGEKFFEWFIKELRSFDIVLIDSRTGINEMSGVCTHHLADGVVMFVTPNQQNIDGTLSIAKSLQNPELIKKARNGRKISLLVVPSRVEQSEKVLLDEFEDDFNKQLKDLISSEISFKRSAFIDLKIPYIPYYAYKEKIALREFERASASDLVESYRNLAHILAKLGSKTSHLYKLSSVLNSSIKTQSKIQERDLNTIISKIIEGQSTEAELSRLGEALSNADSRQLNLQLGKYNVNVEKGKDIHIGDDSYAEWDSKAIKSIVQAIAGDKQAIEKALQQLSHIPSQFQSLITDKTEGFVGREYVFDAINAFIANNSNGYFTIIGDPGQGKTTLLAKYVLDNDYIAHFNLSLQGQNRADQFLESLCNQLINRYQLPYDPLPSNATQDGEFLSQLLDEASQNRNDQPIVIAIDALDEVDQTSYRDAANILYLPPYLPHGVYFILTRRRGVEIPLTGFTSSQLLDLFDYQIDSERDVRTYIQKRVSGSEQLRLRIEERGETITSFTDKIIEKCECNFIYLRYMLLDIETGLYKDLTLEGFPQGIQSYYEFHWRQMGMKSDPLPVEKIKIAYILGEVREPISRRKICGLSGEEEYTVQQVLNEWQQFLHEFISGSEKYYSVYHSSFHDFLHRQDILEKHPVSLPDIHQIIAKNELKVWQKLKDVLRKND